MPQDERRQIFEEQSHHTEIGLAYLPEIARQLHHSRDLGEPFELAGVGTLPSRSFGLVAAQAAVSWLGEVSSKEPEK